MTTRIAIVGAGSWGTALAILLGRSDGAEVRLWARDTELVNTLRTTRQNARYLPDAILPEIVAPTADLAAAVADADFVALAVPCGAARGVSLAMRSALTANAILISAAKGLETGTGLRMSQVISEAIPGADERIVALSGPNLAVEVARGTPTASVAASVSREAAQATQRLFAMQAAPTFRVYTGRDVIGVELGGAIKNVIAIASGVCEGLGYGDNSKAGLMTRGLTEAIRLGVAQGAEAATFSGLSGVGDLIATGNSRLSRNFRVGVALGRGETLESALAGLGQVAEGVPTTRVLCELAARCNVEMPLCRALYAALFENRATPDAIRELMLRPLKEEKLLEAQRKR